MYGKAYNLNHYFTPLLHSYLVPLNRLIMTQASPPSLKVPTAHPRGLYVLFATEMWERFNFYGMRALLVLFLANSLRMGEKESSIIYGGFLGLCYLTPMLGGYMADKYFGNRI